MKLWLMDSDSEGNRVECLRGAYTYILLVVIIYNSYWGGRTGRLLIHTIDYRGLL